MRSTRNVSLDRARRLAVVVLAASTVTVLAQPAAPTAAGLTVEITPLPRDFQIKELPLEVDMDLATQFVRLGFGPMELGRVGFQSTQFLTPTMSTRQTAQLIRSIPEYGSAFRGDDVAEGLQSFAGRVSGVQFGREGSPVLYVELPYWTHQREGPLSGGRGQRISDEDNAALVDELRRVFVDRLHAQEFSRDRINPRKVRIWWHH